MAELQRLVYIVSDVDKALSFEWLAMRLKPSFNLCFVLIGKQDSELERYLVKMGVPCVVIDDRKYPGHFRKWFRLLQLLKSLEPEIVHTHLWRANILGLTCSWVLQIRKRVLTRHHGTVHYNEYRSGRKWDRLCNFMATDIIAISRNVKDILVERDKASPHKIHLLHHGFELSYFERISSDRITGLRRRENIRPTARPIIGVIARYVNWKGIQYVVPAFQRVLNEFPDAHLVLANATGPYKREIQELLRSLPQDSYSEMTFVSDLSALYRLFDVYVHVPIDAHTEAFGQTYIEALLCKVPSVFTLSGIAREFIQDGVHARIVPYKDSMAISEAILELLKNDELRGHFNYNGYNAARTFTLDEHHTNLLKIYR